MRRPRITFDQLSRFRSPAVVKTAMTPVLAVDESSSVSTPPRKRTRPTKPAPAPFNNLYVYGKLHLRALVWNRDRGICAKCGLDTKELTEGIRWAEQWFKRIKDPGRFREYLKAIRYKTGGRITGAWEADHILPVIEGGGECGMENIRTLCIPCHRQATRDLRARMKEAAANAHYADRLSRWKGEAVQTSAREKLCRNPPLPLFDPQ